MSIFDVFKKKPYSPEFQQEFIRLLDELVTIAKKEGFLSEIPGGPFNAQCRHRRARDIGKRLDEIGGFELMEYAFKQVKRRSGKDQAAHLEYAWSGIGHWLP